jgi:hypothetical protein
LFLPEWSQLKEIAEELEKFPVVAMVAEAQPRWIGADHSNRAGGRNRLWIVQPIYGNDSIMFKRTVILFNGALHNDD